MKKTNEKNLKKLYISHCENSAPDMDSLWEKIESGLEEKPESRVTSKPVKRVNFRIAAAWCAVCAAVVIAIPSVILGNKNAGDLSNMAADYREAPDSTETYAAEIDSVNLEDYNNDAAAEAFPTAAADEEALKEEEEVKTEEAVSRDSVYYNSLALAPILSSNRPSEMPYAETSGDDFFVEDNVLIETDIIVDAVVDMVYSSGKGTVCYILSAEDHDKNDIGSITVESATPYLLQMNREYILPLKETGGNYSLVFENAPQIECTLDGGVIFHNGWGSLAENSCEVIYPQNGIDDFFYDRMRFSYTDGMAVITEKWQNVKEKGR